MERRLTRAQPVEDDRPTGKSESDHVRDLVLALA